MKQASHLKAPRWALWLLPLASLLLASPAHPLQERCEVPPELRDLPPPSGSEPIEVGVGIYLIDLIDIDDVEQTFTADFLFSLEWRDPRLAEGSLGFSLARCPVSLEQIWQPYVDIVNRRGSVDANAQPLAIDDDGVVLVRQRILGDLATPLQLRDFPFDTQQLAMDVASFRYGPDEVVLVPNRERTGRRESLSIGGWTLGEARAEVTSELVEVQDRSLAKLEFRLEARRQTTYHLWKVFLPLSLIVLMAWSVFWLDPAQLAPQISVSTASVLTLIAFQLSLGYLLPRLAYLTRIDRFVFGATTLVFLALGEAIATSALVRSRHPERAQALDRWFRWLYLGLFAGVWVVTLAW